MQILAPIEQVVLFFLFHMAIWVIGKQEFIVAPSAAEGRFYQELLCGNQIYRRSLASYGGAKL